MWRKKVVKVILTKLKESALSVFPISVLMLVLILTITDMPLWGVVAFLVGVLLLYIGMFAFNVGIDMSILQMGEIIGSELTKSRKTWVMLSAGFVLGFVVTIAEPDLSVLASQVPAIPNLTLLLSVALGVGALFMIGLLRILMKWEMKYLLLISYTVVFLFAGIAAPDFLAISFDSGGVTTGPITVPFILAIGMGVSAVSAGRQSSEDSFGLCAVCSVGPMIAMTVCGMFFDTSNNEYTSELHGFPEGGEFFALLGKTFVKTLGEVLMTLLPVVVIFLLFQIFRVRVSRSRLGKIFVGMFYTYIGLSVFLTGIHIGFHQAGMYLGEYLGRMEQNFIAIPIAALMGCLVVLAEPAVHVLGRQVSEITNGAIPKKVLLFGMSAGVSIALALAAVRILFRINIWLILLPIYVIAVALAFITPKMFVSIGFDSGGVAAGAMSTAFSLPFAIGLCNAVGGNIMTDAFGCVAFIASLPIITVELIGVIYSVMMKRAEKISKR